MRIIALVIFCSCYVSFSQTLDVNTKKGYAANGFDVVAYFSKKASEGHKNYTTTFEGAKYKFISKENLITFNENPEKYIPQYGGYCAYAIALKKDKVSINPKSFLIIEGRLYLFYNSWGTNTKVLWLDNNPDKLIIEGNKNWETLKLKK